MLVAYLQKGHQQVNESCICGTGEGDEGRLREMCMELLGPGQQASAELAAASGWSPMVCGLNKNKLLQDEVLKRLGDKHLSIRRIKAEFWDLLNAAQEQNPADGA